MFLPPVLLSSISVSLVRYALAGVCSTVHMSLTICTCTGTCLCSTLLVCNCSSDCLQPGTDKVLSPVGSSDYLQPVADKVLLLVESLDYFQLIVDKVLLLASGMLGCLQPTEDEDLLSSMLVGISRLGGPLRIICRGSVATSSLASNV